MPMFLLNSGLVLLLFPHLVFSSILTDSQNGPFPGLGYTPPFKTYSGYLDAKNQKGASNWRMFYWLTESKNDPAKDPLAIYLAGGPGCTSVGEAFQEMGPFYANFGGDSLYENVYAWNARANVLYIDTPIGTGFSYDTNDTMSIYADDDLSRQQNYASIFDFFSRVAPEYKDRDFYLTGSSYSGVWQPMVAALIVDGINNKQFPNPNFKGFAIGNGYLDVIDLSNALVLWQAYHGKVAISQWEQMKKECYVENAGQRQYDMDTYNFFHFASTSNGFDWESDKSACGNFTVGLIDQPEVYNFYLECWGYEEDSSDGMRRKRPLQNPKSQTRFKKGFENHMAQSYRKPNSDPKVNTALLQNFESSDTQYGLPCWIMGAVTNYFNKPEVQKVFHIADDWRGKDGKVKEYVECNDDLYQQYNHSDKLSMQPYFEYIFENWKNPLKILIYNGDVDTVCNYLGDMKFVQRIAGKYNFKESDRTRWNFRGLTAGWQQRFTKDQIIIDMLTVKGAGHFVPNDRGGASVQMITGFFSHNPPNYETNLTNPTPQPIEFQQETVTKETSILSLLPAIGILISAFL
ncbi:unnamed protein product, partial [Mesorhabditis belari]|uniref:Serine carboxypeptidase n=1 Tax=Mesorhabditis belari TaxID=2138241 RepID=A0AAF3FKK1_9BILA